MKICFICMRIKTHSLALKQRLEASLKWPSAFARVREFSIAGNAGILNMHLILISFTLTIWKIDEENTTLINLILTCAETRAKDNKVCFDKTIEVTLIASLIPFIPFCSKLISDFGNNHPAEKGRWPCKLLVCVNKNGGDDQEDEGREHTCTPPLRASLISRPIFLMPPQARGSDSIAHTRSLISMVINTYCGQALTRIVITVFIRISAQPRISANLE